MNEYQKIVKFENGYGASIISHQFSYGGREGLFEIAVLAPDGSICYGTPITSDVIGKLDFQDVVEVLNQIEALPPFTEDAVKRPDSLPWPPHFEEEEEDA